jgi:kinesin family member C2/C3
VFVGCIMSLSTLHLCFVQGGVHVPGLTYRVVNSREDVSRVQNTARQNRTTFCTNMNEHSSRSHCLLSVNVSACNRLTQVTTRGKLHLVDLAGEKWKLCGAR